jgi:hypothetical protein
MVYVIIKFDRDDFFMECRPTPERRTKCHIANLT